MSLILPASKEFNVSWEPNPGSQEMFLTAPYKEVLYEGTRGCGKSDALLIDFAQHVGKGWGPNWTGILFRESFPQLKDIIAKSQKIFRVSFPDATYNKSSYYWEWEEGERLYFSYMKSPHDYWNYHGHEYPWIAWEELCNWVDSQCYELMKACNRSSYSGMPRRYVSTTNPYGVGHGWVKQYWVDPGPAFKKVIDLDSGEERIRIKGYWWECKQLAENDPGYIRQLKSIKDPNLKKAWLLGSWDIVAGGAITDVWDETIHFIRPFQIPRWWRVDRSFDWGSSRPSSVGWWAESDGSQVEVQKGVTRTFPKGTLFRIGEYYTWTGKPNEGTRMLAANIAKKIREVEDRWDFDVQPGPADSSIYDVEDGHCIADEMKAPPNYIKWTNTADKRPGSRVGGLEKLRTMLFNSCQIPMEEPGIFIFNTCSHWRRTVPSLPRDEKDMDDVDTAAEDHCFDDTRYRIRQKTKKSGQVGVTGI